MMLFTLQKMNAQASVLQVRSYLEGILFHNFLVLHTVKEVLCYLSLFPACRTWQLLSRSQEYNTIFFVQVQYINILKVHQPISFLPSPFHFSIMSGALFRWVYLPWSTDWVYWRLKKVKILCQDQFINSNSNIQTISNFEYKMYIKLVYKYIT